jgi:dTDP-4-amino-4,6-dideoxygalactose transaminase
MAGAMGRVSTFSTHPCKSISTGEGGMVTTDDEGIAQFCREFRNVGRRGQEMAMLGYNYTLSDINCALGMSQLKGLDHNIGYRASIAKRYTDALHGDERIQLPTVPDNCKSSWHLYVIRLNLDKLGGATRDQIVDALQAEGIGVAVHYRPVDHHPYYQAKGYTGELCPVAEREAERVISLPIWPGMAAKDAEDTVTALHKVLGAYERELPCK